MKKNQKVTVVQEIQLSPTIEKHDFETKANKAKTILAKGNKVKITYKTESKIINFEILNDDIFEVNLSEFNIKFYEINEVNFEVDEGDSSDSTDKESSDTDEHSNGNNYLSMSFIVYFLYLLL